MKEAYSTDSFTDSDWENICEHIGINLAQSEDEQGEEVNDNKDKKKREKSEERKNIPETKSVKRKKSKEKEMDERDSKGRKEDEKLRKSEDVPEIKSVKRKQLQMKEMDENQSRGTGCKKGKKSEGEKETIDKNSDEVIIQSDTEETNGTTELRRNMKSLRKILKKGRVELLNWNENSQTDVRETYREFRNMSKIVKRKFKALLSGHNEKLPDDTDEKLPDDTTVDTVAECRKEKKVNEDAAPARHKKKKFNVTAGDAKPIHMTFQGQNRYQCPSCDFIGRSFGKTYSHMVEMHNAKSLQCRRCTFTTANPTSLHNHSKLYCTQREKSK